MSLEYPEKMDGLGSSKFMSCNDIYLYGRPQSPTYSAYSAYSTVTQDSNMEDNTTVTNTEQEDGMIDHENEELRDRVASLEKKVVSQEDEILCLKSALSDALRRLTAVEAGRGSPNNLLPNKPTFRGTPRRVHTPTHHQETSRKATTDYSSPVQRGTSPGPRRSEDTSQKSSPRSSQNFKKYSASDLSTPARPYSIYGLSNPETDWNTPPSRYTSMVTLPTRSIHSNHNGSEHSYGRKSPAPVENSYGRKSPAPITDPTTPNRYTPSNSGSKRERSMSRRSLPSQYSSLSALSNRSPSISLFRQKESTFSDEETSLKIYLKGRPVHMIAPTKYSGDYNISAKDELPAEKLKLEWAYGYRGRDCRHNVYLLPTGEIVYFIASVVVLYNAEEQQQRHYLGHNDDVKCLAVHPDKITIASGQVAGHDKKAGKKQPFSYNNFRSQITEESDNLPHVRIWDSVSLNTLHIIGLGDFDRAVCCVAFSKADGGQYLCAVDEANEHNLSLWEWAKGDRGHKVTETKSSTEPVLAAEFHPLERNTIITCGKNQLTFWTIEGGTLSKKLGLFERHEKPKYVLCLAFTDNGDVLSGDSNGNIFVWGKGGNRITQAISGAHEGGIFSLCVMKDGTVLSGGGKDKRIVEWDSSMKRTGLEAELPDQYGPVRTISQGKGNMVLVGTTRNCILQGTLNFKFSAIVQGHMDELWGLSVHPNQHQFITCAYDKHVYLWDTLTHSPVWCKEINEGAHCAAFYPDGSLVAVGTQAAKWIVIDVTTRDVITMHSDGDEQLECIAYSPDGTHLAVGSRDNHVYVYHVSDDGRKYSRIGKCSGHSSFITHLDWSADSQFLRTNSGDYEILFWTATTCRHVTQSSSMRDIEWATQNCTLDFSVAGIWPEGADGTDVNGCCRGNKLKLMASADDKGKVNLFTYPCCHLKAPGHVYGGHSSHVTSVQFLYDDSRLLSTGGKDMAVLQWQIV